VPRFFICGGLNRSPDRVYCFGGTCTDLTCYDEADEKHAPTGGLRVKVGGCLRLPVVGIRSQHTQPKNQIIGVRRAVRNCPQLKRQNEPELLRGTPFTVKHAILRHFKAAHETACERDGLNPLRRANLQPVKPQPAILLRCEGLHGLYSRHERRADVRSDHGTRRMSSRAVVAVG